MIDITPAFTALTPNMHPGARQEWIEALTPAMQSGGIVTAKRAAMFLGQCAVESGCFERLVEDMWYLSAERIHEVYPITIPTIEEARHFVNAPELLANRVYNGKLGNTAADDGWRFRGRGLIQITGRQTYHDCWQAIAPETDFETVFPDLLTAPRHAALSAVWFWGWSHHGAVNALADAWRIGDVTRIVNGGNGELAERVAACGHALTALVSHPAAASVQVAAKPVTADDLNAAELSTITQGA